MPTLVKRYGKAKAALMYVDVPLVRRWYDRLEPVVKPGTYRVAQCQRCQAYHGFKPLEATGLMPKQAVCACGGAVRVTRDYCKVK